MKLLFFVGLILTLLSLGKSLPLDDYVALPDPSYAWELTNTVENEDHVLYVLKLTSQTWDYVLTDKPIWQHWLRIIVPNNLGTGKNALLYISGGSNPLGDSPSSTEDFLPPIATDLGDIVVELNQIPNQPLIFAGEDFARSEDALLAKSWDLFIETRNPFVVARLPMVKAVVKAMDAIQEFVGSLPDVPAPKSFILSGASKRGWTTWLAGAVDTRVVGLIPLVIDVLDMVPNFNEIYQTYGRWPIALQDYINQNLTRCLNCPVFEELAAIEDPLVYIDRFEERNVPVFAVNAAGDEFFIPSGWKWWFLQYTGEKYIRYMPNAEHTLATAIRRVAEVVTAFSYTIDEGIKRPHFTWELNGDKSQITLQTDTTPKSVKLWEAYNQRSRKFIVNCYLTCLWTSTELSSQGNGTYVAKVEIPSEGYRAFMIEVEYDIGMRRNSFIAATGVSIVPDQFDELPCPPEECALCETC